MRGVSKDVYTSIIIIIIIIIIIAIIIKIIINIMVLLRQNNICFISPLMSSLNVCIFEVLGHVNISVIGTRNE